MILLINIVLNLLFFIIMILMMMMSLAFLTLFERKVLGYIQNRKGPNKVGIFGILQPFSDVIKLLNKEFFLLDKINMNYYMFMPMFMLILSLMLWFIYPFYVNNFSMNLGLMLMLSLFGVNIYPIMLMGWSSNSNYSMLGSIRSIAQSISYEVSLFLIIFNLILMIESFNLINFLKYQFMISLIIFMFPVYVMFMISMLIELNRTPFDLVEGESELVSGFNVEYFSSLFAMIFMSEYLSIVFVSFLVTLMFFGMSLMSIKFIIFMIIHMFVIIWIRGVMPRMRYDELMYMCWKKFLSLILLLILFYIGMKEFMIYII